MKFSDQLRQRRLNDEELVRKTYLEIADAVLGARFSESFQSDRDRARTAIGEVLRYYKAALPAAMPETDDVYASIDAACHPSGIMYRRVQLEKGWYRRSFGALLGMKRSTGQIIALIPGPLGGYSYFDAETGMRVKLGRKTETDIAEEALFFYKPLPARALTAKDLLLYAKDVLSAADIAVPILLTALVTLLGLWLPTLNEFLLDEVIREGRPSLLLSTIVFMTSLSLTRLLIGMIRSIYQSRIGTKLTLRLEAATMMRVLDLPAGFFRGYSSGEMAQRAGYVSELCSTILDTVFGTGITSLFSISYVAAISDIAPQLMTPSLLIILATVVVSVANSLMSMKIVKERMLVSGKESGISYALINGIRKIRLGGAEKRALARWGHVYAREARLTYDTPAFLKLNGAITSAITFTGTFLFYLIASRGGVTPAAYFAFTTAFGMVTAAFSGIADVFLSIVEIRPVYEMAEPILKTVPETGANKFRPDGLTGRIELANVSFRYKENGPLILNDLSLEIEPGEFIAVVGRTGSGKSTLIRLLLGFETPQSGAIYYDGRDMRALDLKVLRRRIGTVLQDGRLFSGDIFSNITITSPMLTVEDAWKAAEIAGIADDIRRMPMGMHTLITEDGNGISGGQRQRLLIARAVASKPRVLIFDEATSALDNITQKKVTDSLASLNCTRIVIAHRLSTIRHADRILYLEKGRVTESGTYEQLMKENGRFAELISRQRTDMDAE